MSLPIIHKYCTQVQLDSAAITPGVLYFLTDTGAIWFDTPDNTRICMSGGGSPSGDIDPALSATSQNPVQNKAIHAAIQQVKDIINSLDFAQVGGTGKYVESIKQVDGKITAVAKDFVKATATVDGLMAKEDKAKLDNSYTKTQTDTKIAEEIGKLDVADTAVAGKYVSAVSETDGKITVTREAFTNATATADGMMSKEDKIKLDAIEEGAQKNVQSDWNQTNSVKDDFIKNKPALEEAAYETKAGVLDALTKEIIVAKLGYTPEDEANKGATAGYAPLEDGKVPESYLPAYISEVKEFPDEASLPAVGDSSYLYYAQAEQTTFRWTGSTYSQIASSLSLGETASTAFAGNKGKIAYDHAMKKGAEFATGFYKFSTNDEGHVSNAVAVTKADIENLIGSVDGATITAGTGIDVTNGVVKNTGVTAVAQGSVDGTVKITTNGVTADVPVHGLKSAAYVDTKATLTKTDAANVPTSKAVADYVANELNDYLKAEDEAEYTLEKTADGKKFVFKKDGTAIATLDDNSNVQANWAQTDATADSFILNKPDIYTKDETDDLLDEKVDVETGKGLSANDFTDALKEKLDGIETGATKTEVDTAISATSTNPVQNKVIKQELDKKVDAETGKGLSANDFTNDLKTKLEGLDEDAEENQNAFSKITVNGVTISSAAKEDTFTLAEGSHITLTTDAATKTITIASTGGGGEGGDYDDTAIKARMTAAENKINDMYTKAQVNTELAKKADTATTLAGYGITDAYKKTEVDTELAKKADTATTLAGYGITDAYKKTEVDDLLSDKADSATTLAGYGITDAYTKTDVYTKTETNTELAKKADKATTLSGYGITDAYTKTEVDALIPDVPAYTMDKTTDGKKIQLKKDGVVISTVDDATATAGDDAITYSIALNGNDVKLTGSDGSSSTAAIPQYTVEAGTNGVSVILKKDGTAVSTIDNVCGVKGDSETTYRVGKVNITKDNIGLAKVENMTSAEIRDAMTKAQVVKALGYTPEDVAKKGVANGYAELGANGKVPTSQLPSYLSEIKEFANRAAFPATGDSSIIMLLRIL